MNSVKNLTTAQRWLGNVSNFQNDDSSAFSFHRILATLYDTVSFRLSTAIDNYHSIVEVSTEEPNSRNMPQPSKEPCKKQACDIQACLSKNNFIAQRCLQVIEKLESCCEKCDYNSTHCGSLSGLLKQKPKG